MSGQSKSVLEHLLDWSLERPVWQRDALRRIVCKGTLDDSDIRELATLCKQEKGDVPSDVKAVPLQHQHLPANPGAQDSVSLVSISKVDGVNNLAAGQVLPFSPHGLTIVYGDNGAGKSGYARIFKRSCRTRSPGAAILSNVYAQAGSAPATPAATLVYRIGDVEQPAMRWQDTGKPDPVLSAVSVFDSTCAVVHVEGKNEVASKPFGLDVPDELADACQRVKELLQAERLSAEQAQDRLFSQPFWNPTTKVGAFLSKLTASTKAAELAALSQMGSADLQRLEALKAILSEKGANAAREQRVKAKRADSLAQLVSKLETSTSNWALQRVFTSARAAGSSRETARLAAEALFAGVPLPGVAGEIWRELWESARRYSDEVAYPKATFPPRVEDQLCVLCQQPLQETALTRMQSFDAFIRNDTETQAEEAEKTFTREHQQLTSLVIGSAQTLSDLKELEIQDPALARSVRRFMASCRLRRFLLAGSLSATTAPILPTQLQSPMDSLKTFEASAIQRASELEAAAHDAERIKLQQELNELLDRAALVAHLPKVQAEIMRLGRVKLLDASVSNTSTTAITRVGNTIADQVITPQLRDRFQQEVVRLVADKVRVEIVRCGGRYGSPQYQVRLFASPDTRVANVLSEGERTCVALAAFLTELATAEHRSALIFDDPVTSLDHRWRRRVAARLVEEAAYRQVIVFTHDLVFVNDLFDRAEKDGTPQLCVTAQRGSKGAGIISDGLPWAGKRVEDRLDKLEKMARAAKELFDDSREEQYRTAALEIYSLLRATWERSLEEVVFAKVILRHRDYVNTKSLRKATVLTDADCDVFEGGFKKCCDVTESHDPSLGRNADPPCPAEVLKDIQNLTDWVLSLRNRQKTIA